MKSGDGIPDGAVHADEVFGVPVPDKAINASELLDDTIYQQPVTGTKPSATHTTQTLQKPPIQWLKFTAIMLLVFAILFGGSIYDSDFYQRNFNTEQWEKAQQKRAERAAIRKERTERMKELDQMECHIMLRAKAALMPIEIERNTIYGMSQGKAESFVTKDFESSVELCEKYGISPFTSGAGEQ